MSDIPPMRPVDVGATTDSGRRRTSIPFAFGGGVVGLALVIMTTSWATVTWIPLAVAVVVLIALAAGVAVTNRLRSRMKDRR